MSWLLVTENHLNSFAFIGSGVGVIFQTMNLVSQPLTAKGKVYVWQAGRDNSTF